MMHIKSVNSSFWMRAKILCETVSVSVPCRYLVMIRVYPNKTVPWFDSM